MYIYLLYLQAKLVIKFAFLGSCGGRNSADLWLGFLGNSKLPAADPHLVCVHSNQLVSTLLSRLATSKSSPANLKQLVYTTYAAWANGLAPCMYCRPFYQIVYIAELLLNHISIHCSLCNAFQKISIHALDEYYCYRISIKFIGS